MTTFRGRVFCLGRPMGMPKGAAASIPGLIGAHGPSWRFPLYFALVRITLIRAFWSTCPDCRWWWAKTRAHRPCKNEMAVWRRPRLLRQSNPGVPSDVMVCLRVLARTGRVDCRRPCASFPPFSGSTAMSILCVARWRSARGMTEWMCTQDRLEPGSRHNIWRGGTLPPGYSWQQP